MKLDLLLNNSGERKWYRGNGVGQPAGATLDHILIEPREGYENGDGEGGEADCDDIEMFVEPFTFEHIVTNAALTITYKRI